MMIVILGTTEFATAFTILAPSLMMPAVFTSATNHKTGDILQEYQWNFFLIAIKNESCCLFGAVIIDHATHLHFTLFTFNDLSLVRYNSYSPSINPGITAQNRFAIILL